MLLTWLPSTWMIHLLLSEPIIPEVKLRHLEYIPQPAMREDWKCCWVDSIQLKITWFVSFVILQVATLKMLSNQLNSTWLFWNWELNNSSPLEPDAYLMFSYQHWSHWLCTIWSKSIEIMKSKLDIAKLGKQIPQSLFHQQLPLFLHRHTSIQPT